MRKLHFSITRTDKDGKKRITRVVAYNNAIYVRSNMIQDDDRLFIYKKDIMFLFYLYIKAEIKYMIKWLKKR